MRLAEDLVQLLLVIVLLFEHEQPLIQLLQMLFAFDSKQIAELVVLDHASRSDFLPGRRAGVFRVRELRLRCRGRSR